MKRSKSNSSWKLNSSLLGVVLLSAGLSQPVAAQSANGQIYAAEELTVNPSLASPRQAAQVIQDSYPPQLQRRGIGGSVRLQFVIERDGSVDKASIMVVAATIRRLGEAAKAAVERVKFTPGEVDGRPVRTQIEFPVVYRTQ